MRARAAGSGGAQAPAKVAEPWHRRRPGPRPRPEYERWLVGKATAPVVVRKRPAAGAPVKIRLGVRNANDYPTLVLVDTVREVGGATWYRVWVAMRPNGSRGWVKEGSLAIYTTSAKIEIDLSERKLSVYRRGELKGEYPVAVGRPGLETPTGSFFVNQKLKPPRPGGAFGALAIGISAFQTKLVGLGAGRSGGDPRHQPAGAHRPGRQPRLRAHARQGRAGRERDGADRQPGGHPEVDARPAGERARRRRQDHQ